jgi:hypothetical protein
MKLLNNRQKSKPTEDTWHSQELTRGSWQSGDVVGMVTWQFAELTRGRHRVTDRDTRLGPLCCWWQMDQSHDNMWTNLVVPRGTSLFGNDRCRTRTCDLTNHKPYARPIIIYFILLNHVLIASFECDSMDSRR